MQIYRYRSGFVRYLLNCSASREQNETYFSYAGGEASPPLPLEGDVRVDYLYEFVEICGHVLLDEG